jgi:transcriptional repressor NrdR
MRCPKCGSQDDKVIDSRSARDGACIRRRRECLKCECRFTTYEEIERAELRVLKRDGRWEAFDRHKLYNGIVKACEKRPVSMETLDKTVDEIMHDLETNHDKEVTSQLLGTKVMEKLRSLDEVAYVRYASVYRQFQDIGEFIEEIKLMVNRPKRSALQPELFKT